MPVPWARSSTVDPALVNLEAKAGEKPSNLAKLEIDAVRAQASDLQAELDQYDRLRSGDVSSIEASSLAELSTLLIKARIVRGWTQRQLADALGISVTERAELGGTSAACLTVPFHRANIARPPPFVAVCRCPGTPSDLP